jgi:hypothetical protein
MKSTLSKIFSLFRLSKLLMISLALLVWHWVEYAADEFLDAYLLASYRSKCGTK